MRQIAALIQQCNVYITNDCGVMHISVAVQTPTIAIFGPGNPEVWFPYTLEDGHLLFHHKPNCYPCGGKDFCDDMYCMKGIKAEAVFNGVQTLLF